MTNEEVQAFLDASYARWKAENAVAVPAVADVDEDVDDDADWTCGTCGQPVEPPAAYCAACLVVAVRTMATVFGLEEGTDYTWSADDSMWRNDFAMHVWECWSFYAGLEPAEHQQESFACLVRDFPQEVLQRGDRCPPALLAAYRASLSWDPDAPITETVQEITANQLQAMISLVCEAVLDDEDWPEAALPLLSDIVQPLVQQAAETCYQAGHAGGEDTSIPPTLGALRATLRAMVKQAALPDWGPGWTTRLCNRLLGRCIKSSKWGWSKQHPELAPWAFTLGQAAAQAESSDFRATIAGLSSARVGILAAFLNDHPLPFAARPPFFFDHVGALVRQGLLYRDNDREQRYYGRVIRVYGLGVIHRLHEVRVPIEALYSVTLATELALRTTPRQPEEPQVLKRRPSRARRKRG